MRTKTTLLFILLVFLNISCDLFEKEEEKGCTDIKALNRDILAESDDGSCLYSTVSFYASAGFFNGIPISKIDVTVNGNGIGTIPGTYYPNGPGNCSAQGTVQFKFTSGNKVDWNTTVHLVNGATLFGSGQVEPLSTSDCIRVNVTR